MAQCRRAEPRHSDRRLRSPLVARRRGRHRGRGRGPLDRLGRPLLVASCCLVVAVDRRVVRRSPRRGGRACVAAVFARGRRRRGGSSLLVGEPQPGASCSSRCSVLAFATAGLARVRVARRSREPRATQPPPGVRGRPPAPHPVLIYNPKSGGGKADAEFVAAAEATRHRAVDLDPGARPRAARPRRDRAAAPTWWAWRAATVRRRWSPGSPRSTTCRSCASPPVPAITSRSTSASTATTWSGALDAFADGYERRVDLATVNGRVFVNNVSLGLYARDRAVRRVPRRQGGHRGADAARPARQRLRPVRLPSRRPDGVDESDPDLMLVSNNVYKLSGIGGFGTRARLDEGVLGRDRHRRARRARISPSSSRCRVRGARLLVPRAGTSGATATARGASRAGRSTPASTARR